MGERHATSGLARAPARDRGLAAPGRDLLGVLARELALLGIALPAKGAVAPREHVSRRAVQPACRRRRALRRRARCLLPARRCHPNPNPTPTPNPNPNPNPNPTPKPTPTPNGRMAEDDAKRLHPPEGRGRTARGELPLLLRRQPPPGPLAVREPVVPGNVDHRVLLPGGGVFSRAAQLCAVLKSWPPFQALPT